MSNTTARAAGLDARRLLECGIWLAIAAGMWAYSFDFDRELQAYAFGPVSWPRAVLCLLAVFAVLSLYVDLREARARHGSHRPPNARENTPPHGMISGGQGMSAVGEDSAMTWPARMQLFIAMVLPLLYAWLMPRAGYYAATPLFIVAYMLVLGERRPSILVGCTVAIYVVLLAVFSKLLYIPLPAGNWPGFYDYSNELLIFLGKL